jgi:isoleucyl-tRNA synthetase
MKNTTIAYANALEKYDIPASANLIQPCIDNISRWWIRRSRNRFANGDTNALQTLYATMVLFAKTFAPQMPFLTEQMYQNLVINAGLKDAQESIHLEDYPTFDEKDIDHELLKKMELAREICSNGLKVREDTGNNLRQPLVDAYIGVDDSVVMGIVKDELNVGDVKYSKTPVTDNGYASFGEAEKFVSINTAISEELKAQGMVNDFMRKYRDIRKKKGLNVNDMVNLIICVEDIAVKEALKNYADSNMNTLQANTVEFVDALENPDGSIVIDEKTLTVKLN